MLKCQLCLSSLTCLSHYPGCPVCPAGSDNHDDHDVPGHHDGASPNSHKHFIPYMGFCASIWDNVPHHCHHHHHHNHHHISYIKVEHIFIYKLPTIINLVSPQNGVRYEVIFTSIIIKVHIKIILVFILFYLDDLQSFHSKALSHTELLLQVEEEENGEHKVGQLVTKVTVGEIV